VVGGPSGSATARPRPVREEQNGASVGAGQRLHARMAIEIRRDVQLGIDEARLVMRAVPSASDAREDAGETPPRAARDGVRWAQ